MFGSGIREGNDGDCRERRLEAKFQKGHLCESIFPFCVLSGRFIRDEEIEMKTRAGRRDFHSNFRGHGIAAASYLG